MESRAPVGLDSPTRRGKIAPLLVALPASKSVHVTVPVHAGAVPVTSADFERSFYALADSAGARGFVPKAQLAEVDFTIFWPTTVPALPSRV